LIEWPVSFQVVSELGPLHFDFTVKWATIMAIGEGYYLIKVVPLLNLIWLETLIFLIGKT